MRQCKKRLLIIGASGHGRVCADVAEKMNLWDEIVFADDNPPAAFPYRIIGGSNIEWNEDCFIGIGNGAIREKLSKSGNLVTLIHPNAVIGDRVKIGRGTVVMAGAVINADAEIGSNAIINTCASVDHDSQIGDFVHVSVGAHIAGTVTIGENTWIGAGATVKNNVNICGGCTIGAGAVVIKDITETGTYMGVPAKMKTNADNCINIRGGVKPCSGFAYCIVSSTNAVISRIAVTSGSAAISQIGEEFTEMEVAA